MGWNVSCATAFGVFSGSVVPVFEALQACMDHFRERDARRQTSNAAGKTGHASRASAAHTFTAAAHARTSGPRPPYPACLLSARPLLLLQTETKSSTIASAEECTAGSTACDECAVRSVARPEPDLGLPKPSAEWPISWASHDHDQVVPCSLFIFPTRRHPIGWCEASPGSGRHPPPCACDASSKTRAKGHPGGARGSEIGRGAGRAMERRLLRRGPILSNRLRRLTRTRHRNCNKPGTTFE